MADVPRVHVHPEVSDPAKSRDCYARFLGGAAPRGLPRARGPACRASS